MERWTDVTLADLLRSVGRYRFFIVFVAGVLVMALLAPGSRLADTGTSSLSQGPRSAGGQTVRAGTGGDSSVTGSGTAAAGGVVRTSEGGVTSGGTDGGDTGGGVVEAAPAPAVVSAGEQDPLAAADCDATLGRIKYPSVYAPPCVPEWPEGADNGGETAVRGVTADEIVVAIRFNPDPSPAGQAILLAAGVDDSQEEVRETRAGYVELLQQHFRTYGRTVRVEYFPQSGDDDEADRADAIHVATNIKAFAAWGGSGAYRDELVARGVLCISCGTSEPIETYLGYAPYVWGTLMASSQAYIHRAEYIGKRLWGNDAEWAGDPAYNLQQRKLGLVYFETDDGAYKAGADFFEQELATYGAHLTDRIAYILDLATIQEQARTMIARLKDKGVTSVVFAGDPITPAFLTKEATNQNYFPEWVITGSALTDTALFARTYDQSQWQNAFGISMLAARAPHTVSDPWRLYEWHHGEGPPADDSYGVIYPTPWIFFTGVHLAGANLNVETFRDGLFSFPVSAVGGVTNVQTSFGHHGIWPWEDYLAYDDMTEIWWDPSRVGPDETGKEGPGMYQYVNGGVRYGAGAWPATVPAAFDPEGAVTIYEEQPPQDKAPDYPHEPHE